MAKVKYLRILAMAKIFQCFLSLYMVLQFADAIHVLEKRQLVTCPGFPGYCSEAYPGGVCTVVCAFGRPNVPECQPDGTWTDIPRCIEHEPGKQSQVPGRCPGIPGYCSDDLPGGVCEFDCLFGPDIRSFCTPDGTWDPYPFCEGDIRETRDGCDGCPGPFGGPRNRTAEAAGGGGNGRKNGNNRKNGGSNNRKQPNQPARPANNRRPQGPKQQARPARPASNNRRNNGGNGGNNRRNNGGNNRRSNGNNRQTTGNNRRNNARPQNNNRRPQAAKPRPQISNRSSNNRNGGSKRPTNKNSSKASAAQNSASSNGRCPGGDLEMCIDVCPSFSARIFGACVSGCAKRCPSKK